VFNSNFEALVFPDQVVPFLVDLVEFPNEPVVLTIDRHVFLLELLVFLLVGPPL